MFRAGGDLNFATCNIEYERQTLSDQEQERVHKAYLDQASWANIWQEEYMAEYHKYQGPLRVVRGFLIPEMYACYNGWKAKVCLENVDEEQEFCAVVLHFVVVLVFLHLII